MKKVLRMTMIAILMVGIMFTFGACGKKDEESKEESNPSNSGNSSEGIINEFVKYVADKDVEKAAKCIDIDSVYAVQIADTVDVDFDEAYGVVTNVDKDADYIKENYKDFSKAWEDVRGKEITDDDLDDLEDMIDESEGEMKSYIEDLVSSCENSSVKEIKEIESDNDEHKYENLSYYEVTISYDEDGEEEESKLEFWTIKLDGKGYIVNIQ